MNSSAGSKINGKQLEDFGNALLFFLQREKDELTPNLLHKRFGKKTLRLILLSVEGKVKQWE
jgi:hypothetical protein